MQDATRDVDVVVGCHSTAVLESLFQLKVPIFLRTQKWGDYYDMAESDETRILLVENPEELVNRIKNVKTISQELLIKLREQYLGDPHKNGSVWVIDQLEKLL